MDEITPPLPLPKGREPWPRWQTVAIDFSPYELVAQADGRRREGALLRMTFDDGVRGYSDVHPWPTLGDAPLDRQLSALSESEPEALARCSIDLARADGEARAAGRSLFEGLMVPPSHASLPFGFTTDDWARVKAGGYSRVKLKGWAFSPEQLAFFRESGLLFRLDFNAHLNAEEIRRLLDGWGDLSWVDWIEDPCPYDANVWTTLQTQVRVAIDFEQGGSGFDVRVMKPAKDCGLWIVDCGEDATPISTIHNPQSTIAFTSYLDHPVGQLGAAWVAARATAAGLPVEPGGLVTHEVYEPTEFSRQLGVDRGRLIPPGGPGLGFGRELERLPWRTLKG